jgi:putative DNA primase/helicase
MANINSPAALSIITGLGGDVSTGMCQCPAHDDSTASLHVSESNDGKVLVKCHAGCTQERVLRGLRERRLWRPTHDNATSPRSGGGADDPSPAFVEYQRERKALSIQRAAAVANAGPPTAYLNGRGITAIPDNIMLLPPGRPQMTIGLRRYRAGLPEGFDLRYPKMVVSIMNDGALGTHVTYLTRDGTKKLASDRPKQMFGVCKGGSIPIGQPQTDGPLLVAEGIETALSVAQITGLPAIAALSADNLSVVRVPDCSEVIICADNDNAGREGAKALSQRLAGRRVRIAIPDGPKGYDWNDALQSGADPKKLNDQIRTAKLVKAPTGVETLALSVADFRSLTFPDLEFLMKPWLTTAGIHMIYGPPGNGKSHLALGIAHAVAQQRPLMKWECNRKARVLYVDGELSGRRLQERLGMLGPAPASDALKVVNRDYVIQRLKRSLDLGRDEDRGLLDRIIEAHQIEMIILDSIMTLCTGIDAQKEASPWLPMQEWAYRHREAGRTILYIHHASRAGSPFGTMAREIPMDAIIKLEKDPKIDAADDESVIKLTFPKPREFFGADAAPMIIRFSTRSGVMEWSCESERESTSERVASLMAQGYSQRDAAKEVGVTESRVSQLVKARTLRKK